MSTTERQLKSNFPCLTHYNYVYMCVYIASYAEFDSQLDANLIPSTSTLSLYHNSVSISKFVVLWTKIQLFHTVCLGFIPAYSLVYFTPLYLPRSSNTCSSKYKCSVYNATYNSPARLRMIVRQRDLLQELHKLSLNCRNNPQDFFFFWHSVIATTDLLIPYAPSRLPRSTSVHFFNILRMKLTFSSCSFCVYASKVWNSTDNTILVILKPFSLLKDIMKHITSRLPLPFIII